MNKELEERLHDLSYVLSYEEIEELRSLCYEHSNSWCPLSDFFNDICWNTSKTYNKNQAYKDLWLIALIVLDRKNEHKALEIIRKHNGINEETMNMIKWYSYPEYCNQRCNHNPEYTKEEYDLLKEVLL